MPKHALRHAAAPWTEAKRVALIEAEEPQIWLLVDREDCTHLVKGEVTEDLAQQGGDLAQQAERALKGCDA